MIETAYLYIVQGLFAGFILGMIDAYSEKLFLVVLGFIGIVIHEWDVAMEVITPIWGCILLILAFIVGHSDGKRMYEEAMQ